MIEKNTPKKFVADKDERLLEPGDMTEAQNVTITERGEGSGSILKTFKGTTESSPNILVSEPNLSEAVTVIGKVEDPQRNFVYFFVADDVGSTMDSIIQHDPASDTYKTVLRSSWLNFSKSVFVKADIINKDFKRDGTLESVIYFTDNDNPPRKINVDRALAGEYENFSNSEMDIALGAMRAAPTKPPTFTFDTDLNVSTNNFIQDTLQYATQIIYKDGEVSALSPYSKLAISQPAAFGGMETTNYNVVPYQDNVCDIEHNINLSHPDLSKVRLLARSGNGGAFFVVDEFDPNVLKERDLPGGTTTVYNPGTKRYTFYNDILGRSLSDSSVNKLYDNVPLRAEGQSVTGSRLMYSNYTEGFNNAPLDPSHFSITPIYGSEGSGISLFANDTDAPTMFDDGGGTSMDITLTLTDAAGISPSTTFPAGTLIDFQFTFKPEFNAEAVTGNVIEIDRIGIDEGPIYTVDNITLIKNDFAFPTPNETNQRVSLTLVTPVDYASPTALANFIQEQLENVEVAISYSFNNTNLTIEGTSDTVTADFTLDVFFKFGEIASSANDEVQIKSRISDMKVAAFSVDSTSSDYDIFLSNGNNAFGKSGSVQSEITYTAITNNISGEQINISALGELQTFKQGATHAFGVVFYDKYGRSGHVNEIGSVYVKAPHERTTPAFGPVSMEFDFSDDDINPSIPSWADSYQIVYTGSSIADTFQYTVGGASPRYLTSEGASYHDLDTSVHNIYVSLKTLDQYRRDKDVLRNYSFTEGDKLRIISRRNNSDSAWEYPSSSDGDILEFDVVGVETIDSDPLRKNKTAFTGSDEQHPHKGTYLVLTAPAVEATAGVVGGVNKYVGFDWHHITGTDYNATDTVTQGNFWNWNCLVEIITPKKSTSEKVYYEIGERRGIGGYKNVLLSNMGPKFTVVSGDVHYRPVSAKTPVYNVSWQTNPDLENPEEWEYQARYIEDPSVSDLFSSKSWDKGRAHSVFRDAAQVTRYNGITYSEAYADDTAVLNLSSFNPTLINFFDLPSEHGACKYIGNISDKLIAVQENKLSFIGVNKDVIETGSQSGLISLSTSVLNNISPFGGDYGTQNAESVLIRDGAIYFVDKSRRAIIRASQKGMEVISDKDIKSYVESQFNLWTAESGSRIVSGYDPDDNVYYVTLEPKGSFAGLTLGYNLGGFWQGTYTFYPTCYAAINDNFIVCRYTVTTSGSHNLLFTFNTENTNQFFDELIRDASKVSVVSNENPSMVKQYNSISLEGDTAWTTTLESSTGQTTASLSFTEREDAFYADVSGDTSSNSVNHYIPVGDIASEAAGVITMAHSMQGLQIPLGYTLYKNNGISGFSTLTETVSAVDRGAKTISHSGAGTLGVSAGDRLFVAAAQQLTGDQIRGHYCKVKCTLTPSGTQRHELYSINTNFVNSKANHG